MQTQIKMHSIPRRQFLKRLGIAFGSSSLAACGGGTTAAVAPESTPKSAAAPPQPPTVPASPPPSSPPPVSQPPAPPPPAPPPPPANTPAWLADKPLNAWLQIPGTVYAGSPAAPTLDPTSEWSDANNRLSFSGMALRNAEIIIAASGGHGDYSGNEVTSIDLSANSPVWVLRKSKSPPTADVAYYADGTPTSRHLYWSSQWSATRNRLMLHYTRVSYGSAVNFAASNGFNLDDNTWDAAGTWSGGYAALCQDSSGNCWAASGYFTLMKWTAATDTWAAASGVFPGAIYPCMSYDSLRDQLFQFSWGNGEGSGIGVTAFKYNAAGTTQTAITLNASAAYSQFQADTPQLAGMDYDPINDRFLFYQAQGIVAAPTTRIYVITPNAGNAWDMSILSVTGVTPPAAAGAGVCSRFAYVPSLKGFVYMARGTTNIHFFRTA